MKIYRIQLGRKGGERIRSYLDPILTFNFLQEKLLRQTSTSTPLRFITKARNEVMKNPVTCNVMKVSTMSLLHDNDDMSHIQKQTVFL